MEQFFNSAWFAAVLTVLGILLGSAVAVNWAHKNGEALGRRVGRWLPGDQVEKWLVQFLLGLKQGLEETYTPTTIEASKVASPAPGAAATWKIDLRPNELPKSPGA